MVGGYEAKLVAMLLEEEDYFDNGNTVKCIYNAWHHNDFLSRVSGEIIT